jgi:hypothetical protein
MFEVIDRVEEERAYGFYIRERDFCGRGDLIRAYNWGHKCVRSINSIIFGV